MAAKDNIGKASQAARAASDNEYVKRLIEDEDLRGNLLAAYAAARSAYGRVSNGKTPAKALFDDKKLQRELAQAANSLRDASEALKKPAKSSHRRGGGVGRSLLVLAVAAVLAVALSESLRAKVLDLLFGAEEEFDYSSTTMPAEAAPSAAGAAAAG
jgi:predicted aminopeptidase